MTISSKPFKSPITLFFIGLIMFGIHMTAHAACGAGGERYSVHGDGTVTDHKTKLMWAQCAQGQTASAGSCINSAAFTWEGALGETAPSTTSSHTGWRLPNIKELESLIQRECDYPAINESVFPNPTPIPSLIRYWSSTPSVTVFVTDATVSWTIDLAEGQIYSSSRTDFAYVRLVRYAQ